MQISNTVTPEKIRPNKAWSTTIIFDVRQKEKPTMRLLVSGGPGSGCTSTAEKISQEMCVAMFDSDSFFHKPSNPPFQEQYSPEERRLMLDSALSGTSSWIVSGSVATWGLSLFRPTHGVLLNVGKTVRLQRLMKRQRNQFGPRIDIGGDMHDEHEAFIEWAAAYEERVGIGRNLAADREFLLTQCDSFMSIDQIADIHVIAGRIMNFLSNKNEPDEALEGSRLPGAISAISALRTDTDRARQPSPSA